MATFKFTKTQGVGKQQRFSVEEKRFPNHALSQKNLDSQEQLQIRPGKPGHFPVGTDTTAPRIYPRG